MRRTALAARPVAVLAALWCAVACSGGDGGLRDPCDSGGTVGPQTPVVLDASSDDCESEVCVAAGDVEHCSKACGGRGDCPADMMCMPMAPYYSGAYCLIARVPSQGVQPTAPQPGSARSDADTALAAARAGWAPDAYVVEVMGHDIGTDGLRGDAGRWRFGLYAPSKPGRKTGVSVTKDGAEEGFIEHDIKDVFDPDAIDIIGEGLWVFDSQDVPALARVHGADAFLADHPAATASLSLTLGVFDSAPMAMWQYGLTDMAARASDSWLLDARSGDKIFF